MARPTRYFRKFDFTRSANNKESFSNPALDAEHSGIETALNNVIDTLNGITDANGRLVNLSSSTAMALAGFFQQTAGGALIYVQTTIVYDASFTSSNVFVYLNGTMVNPATVTISNSGGFVRATLGSIPAAGVIEEVLAFSQGAGISTDLASVAVSKGASLVGIFDAGGLIAATTVENALQEIVTSLNTLIAGVGTTTLLFKKDGSVTATGNFNLGGFKITGGAVATVATDFVIKSQLDAYANIWNNLSTYYLALAGGTMSGPLSMGNQLITNLAAATAAGHAVRYEQWIATPATYITSGVLDKARLPVMIGDSGTGGSAGAVPAPGAGDSTKVLYGSGAWGAIAASIGSGWCLLSHTAVSGSAAQASVAATWNTRTLNTKVESVTPAVITLGANQFTLPAGTYRVRANGPGYQCNLHQLRIRNITDGTTAAVGTSTNSSAADFTATMALLSGRFTIASPKVFELQHFTTTANANGLGNPVTSGEVETYGVVELIKE